MSKKKRPWDNPRVYALVVAGAVCMAVGEIVLDSLMMVLLGGALLLAGVVIGKRT